MLIELDPVDRITAGAVGEPGRRTFYLQGRKDQRVITLLVEKQQVQLLAASIVEILARVGKETGQGPPEDAMGLEEPIVPEWRVGRLSIGYQEGRDLLMLEAGELLPDEEPSDQDLTEVEDEPLEEEGEGREPGRDVQAALADQLGVYTVEAVLEEPEAEPVEPERPPEGPEEAGQHGSETLAAERLPGLEPQDTGREPSAIRFWATREQMLSLARHAAAVCAAGRPRCQLCGTPLDLEGHVCPALDGHRPSDAT